LKGVSLRIAGLKNLDDAKKKYADIRAPLNAWINEVEEALWNSPQDIKKRFANASFLEENIIFFNIKGNHYRLRVQVDYQLKIVVIEWIGPHAEYTKKYC
jgi:mRNA interferase HigB